MCAALASPLALVTPIPSIISQECFVEVLNSYFLWRAEKMKEESQQERFLSQELDSHQQDGGHLCPISKTPIRHPVQFNGIWFERSNLLEFLEYAVMISGERKQLNERN